MKCFICLKPVLKRQPSAQCNLHEGKCNIARRIVCTSVDDSKYGLMDCNDLEALELALAYEKRSVQPRKGIIQGIERRMRKIQKETPKKCRVCGCTDYKACPGGCYWVEADLCSQCAKE